MNSFEIEWERPEFGSVPELAENAVYLLPGCDNLTLRKTLLETYRDFCKRSAALRTWRSVAFPVDGAPGDAIHGGDGFFGFGVSLSPVLAGEIDCVTQIVLAGRGFHRRIRDWRAGGYPMTVTLPHVSIHDFFVGRFDENLVQRRENVGTLPPGEDPGTLPRREPLRLWVETVEVPSINEERAPRGFLRRYGDAIVDGALARLFSMSTRQWHDPEQARQRGIAYSNAMSEARLRANSGGDAENARGRLALDFSSMV